MRAVWPAFSEALKKVEVTRGTDFYVEFEQEGEGKIASVGSALKGGGSVSVSRSKVDLEVNEVIEAEVDGIREVNRCRVPGSSLSVV